MAFKFGGIWIRSLECVFKNHHLARLTCLFLLRSSKAAVQRPCQLRAQEQQCGGTVGQLKQGMVLMALRVGMGTAMDMDGSSMVPRYGCFQK